MRLNEVVYLPDMFRRYTIVITVNETMAEQLHGVEKELGCSISEPSNWVEYGSTSERGLTFLDKNGRELESSIFIHQPYFYLPKVEEESEAHEIMHFIFKTLSTHFSITSDDVKIKVSAYNRL